MPSIKYLKGRFFHRLEYFKRSGNFLKPQLEYYPAQFHAWCGMDYLCLKPSFEESRVTLVKKYTKLKGELGRVSVHHNQALSYEDHVTRIQVKGERLAPAIFTQPQLSSQSYKLINLADLGSCPQSILSLATRYPQLAALPMPFDYLNMEQGAENNIPFSVGCPASCGDRFVLNADGRLKESVLHLPLKISQAKAESLVREGRVIADGYSEPSHQQIYLPSELVSLAPLIEYTCHIEKQFNPYFMKDYYLFLSVSHSVVEPMKMQRRGGWHIDGHQGHERLQKDGRKLPCDRQYLISDVLATQAIRMKFDFERVRAYCKQTFCDLDSINMQDVIEQQASQYEKLGNIQAIKLNQLNFLNPYMVHRAVYNETQQPIRRTFVRILFSTFTRNRLGDSVNPILGPLYPLKVKTIRDIHEIPASVYLS